MHREFKYMTGGRSGVADGRGASGLRGPVQAILVPSVRKGPVAHVQELCGLGAHVARLLHGLLQQVFLELLVTDSGVGYLHGKDAFDAALVFG